MHDDKKQLMHLQIEILQMQEIVNHGGIAEFCPNSLDVGKKQV